MKKIVILENVLRSLLNSDILPSTILTAFHNICAHGEALEDVGLNVTDETLEQLFIGFDTSLNALHAMER